MLDTYLQELRQEMSVFCGNVMKKYEQVLDSECDEPCPGNEDEFCGGDWRISVYNISELTTTQQMTTPIQTTENTDAVTVNLTNFTNTTFSSTSQRPPRTDSAIEVKHSSKTALMPVGYIGCFEDSSNRVLNGNDKDFDPNSSQSCKRYCRDEGYRYAGTESGEECFCGHDIRYKTHSDACDHKCEGNSAEICGGDWKISIYDTWHCATQPCKNDATCKDIDANTYNCSCTNGWTGKNCEQEKPVPSSTTTSATITTVKETTVQKTQSLVYINATESNIILKSTATTTTNTSEIQYINSAGDANNSMIAAYVLLPLFVCVIVVITAIVLKRRRRLKEQGIPEVISQGSDSVQNRIANGMTPLINQSDNINNSQNMFGDTAALTGDEIEYSVIRKEKRPEKLELEEYNTLNLRSDNSLVSDNSYSHVAMSTNTSDKTYSQLSASQLTIEQNMLNNTYSHIEKHQADIHTSGSAEILDKTYNNLMLKKISRSEETERGLEVNHTGLFTETEENDFVYINTVKEVKNARSEGNRLREENIYYNE